MQKMIPFGTTDHDLLQNFHVDRFFTNYYGVVFKVSSFFPAEQLEIAPKNSIRVCEFYFCTRCSKIYTSKSSVLGHNCKNQSTASEFNPQQAFNDLFILIAVNNLSFTCVTSAPFRTFVCDLNPRFDIPSDKTLKRKMYDFAEKINKNVLKSLKGKIVSLLFDSAKRIGEYFEGIIIFTPEQLYFYPFSIIDRSTAQEISTVISNAINFLNSNGTTVISACCDSASANVAAFNPNHSYAIPLRIGEGIIRIRCCAHLCELASSDVYSKDFPGIINAIIKILKICPSGIRTLPKFTKVRWNSIDECINFILKHADFYSSHEKTKDIFGTIEEMYHWSVLKRITSIMLNLTSLLERDHATLALIFSYLVNTIKNLEALQNSIVAQKMIDALHNRFLNAPQMRLPCCAFLLTSVGLMNFRNLTNDELRNQVFICALQGIEIYASERRIFDIEQVKNGFMWYLYESNMPWDWNKPPEFTYAKAISNPNDIHFQFFKTAYEIVQIPCSEAPVERFFTHIEKILSPQRHRLSQRMIETLSIIKMNYLFNTEMKPVSFAFLEREIELGVEKMKQNSFYPQVRYDSPH